MTTMTDLNKRAIDLSHWNVIPESLHPAAEAGVWGVIHKATEGSGGNDGKYSSRRFLAGQAGLMWGAYHFLRPGDMKAQAAHFIEVAEPDSKILLAADHEDDRVSLTNLQTWLEEVERLTGKRPVIYSGHVLKDQLSNKPHPVLNGDNYLLWLAQYATTAKLPPGWSKYWIWQYTDSGTVPGVDPPVDVNDYQGTQDELRASWTGSREPGPAPEPTGEELSTTAFQAALANAGYYAGEIDGLSGPMTRGAVDEWFDDGKPLAL